SRTEAVELDVPTREAVRARSRRQAPARACQVRLLVPSRTVANAQHALGLSEDDRHSSVPECWQPCRFRGLWPIHRSKDRDAWPETHQPPSVSAQACPRHELESELCASDPQ